MLVAPMGWVEDAWHCSRDRALRPRTSRTVTSRTDFAREPAIRLCGGSHKKTLGTSIEAKPGDSPQLPPATSGLWSVPNVLITPHTAGETRRYEDNVIDLLLENLARLWRGETVLKNQFI